MANQVRRVLLGLALVTAMAATAAAQTKRDPTIVRVLSLPILDVGAMFYGVDEGIFEKHGLKIVEATTTGGAAGVPAMIGGEADIIYGATITAVLARAQNLPVKLLAAAAVSLPESAAKRDYVAIIAGPESGVKSVKDLAGKKMLVNTLNNLNHLYEMAWLEQQGVDRNSVEFLEVPFPSQPAAVLSGRAAATMIGAPFLQALEAKGGKILGWPFRAQSLPVVVGSYITTDQYAQKNPAVLKQFVAALDESIHEIENPANRAKVVAAFSHHTHMPPALVETVTLPTYKSKIDLASLQQTVDLAKKYGLLKTSIDLPNLLVETAK